MIIGLSAILVLPQSDGSHCKEFPTTDTVYQLLKGLIEATNIQIK